MIVSTFDLAIAIGVFFLMPLIIWVNLRNREVGVMGYLWHESPWLARIGLIFLALTWIVTAVELGAHYGLLSAATVDTASLILFVPMLVFSIVILTMGGLVLAKYLKSRRVQ